MTLRESVIWAVAGVLSLGLHLALFWPGMLTFSAEDGKARQEAGVTRLSFRVAARPQPPAPVPEVQPPPRPEPPKPRPVEPRPVEPKPTQRTVAADPVPPRESEPIAESPPAPAPVQTAGDPQQQEQEQARRHYLGELLARIEEHKFYPRAARRRGLQGVVQVSFVLHDNGQVSEILVGEGHELLRRAAEEAVRAALPLPLPPREVACPLQVSYGMEFQLN